MLCKTKHTLVTLAAIALAASQVAVVTAAAGDREAVLRDIGRAVADYAFLTVFDDVNMHVDQEGIVVLRGHVTELGKRAALARRVRAVDGVVGVRNDLDVLPVSHRDTELRYQIARAIYGNRTFWHYAARRNPPIHILVRDGHITLTGLVKSEDERAMAGVLASQFAAVSLTNDLDLVTTDGPVLD